MVSVLFGGGDEGDRTLDLLNAMGSFSVAHGSFFAIPSSKSPDVLLIYAD